MSSRSPSSADVSVPSQASPGSSSSSSQFRVYDELSVSLVPEKKGVFLKHSEYEIRCCSNLCVYRRYNDFLTLHNYLLTKFPYRLIPRLPPKQLMVDSLLELRRRGLANWLKIVCCHPILSQSEILRVFMADNEAAYQENLRLACQSEVDEFTRLSTDAELPLEDQGRLARSRENMRRMLNALTNVKKLVDHQVERTRAQGKDLEELAMILRTGATLPASMAEGVQNVSQAADCFARKQQKTIGERLVILLEILHGHSDLCDRVEKGIMAEHQKALSKMLNLNRQKIKGVIRGTGAENVSALHEQEVQQTGVVGKLGRRSAFSLHCILAETALAQQYLEAVPSILLSFCHEQHMGNQELATIWSQIVAAETQSLNK